MERKQSGQPQTEEDIYRKISDMAEEQRDELIQLRRDFHRYPETSWLEMRTSAKIAEYLTELGMEVLTGKDDAPDPLLLPWGARQYQISERRSAPPRSGGFLPLPYTPVPVPLSKTGRVRPAPSPG